MRLFIFLLLLVLSMSWMWYNHDPKNQIELGERLFFDPILSKDSTVSCSSCHKPAFAFADTVSFSKGVGGMRGKRNAPSVMNMASREAFFYDGRAKTLQDQVHFPIEDPNEMNVALSSVVDRLNADRTYSKWFRTIYNEPVTPSNLSMAIAAFEETLETSDTEFDAWMKDEPNKMTESAIRGRTLFLSPRAKCFDCHFSPDFTVDQFKNIGLYDNKKYKDTGRYQVTGKKDDLGKFKVPGLRNIAVTAPYMHDGSFRTLKEVIEYYSNPYQFVQNPINMDSTLLKPLNLTKMEKEDLEAFLLSLTDRKFQHSKQ